MSLDRALAFVMPFGKHKDQTLGEIKEEDPNYVVWAAQNFDEGSAQRAAQCVVEAMDTGDDPSSPGPADAS